MSCKLSMNNSVKLNSDSQWVKTSSIDSNVKLAGEEAKDRLYEPKHKKKLVRVLTVVAYVFFVSLAAIMLSLYYVFLWNGNSRDASKSRLTADTQYTTEVPYTNEKCNNRDVVLVDVPFEPTAIPVVEAIASTERQEEPDRDIISWSDNQSNYSSILTGQINPSVKKFLGIPNE